MCRSMYISSPIPLIHLWHTFCSSGNGLRFLSESWISSLNCSASIIISSVGTLWVCCCCWGWYLFWNSFWIRADLFYYSHSFRYFYIFKASIHFESQSVMDRNGFFKPISIYAIISWCFQVWYYFECCYEWIKVYFHLRSPYQSFWLFSYLAYPFGFSVMFSSFPYFAPKLFWFLVVRLLVCLRAFSPYLLVIFFSLFWNVLFYLYYCSWFQKSRRRRINLLDASQLA